MLYCHLLYCTRGFNEVYYVVDTVIDQLEKDPKRHFIYVETAFFARWWDEQSAARRAVLTNKIDRMCAKADTMGGHTRPMICHAARHAQALDCAPG